MKTFVITKIFEDDTSMVMEYPCSKWEVSLILISTASVFPLRGVIEFKSYNADGTQVREKHYFSEFKIVNTD